MRVTTAKGGNTAIAKARKILRQEFPELAAQMELHVPDEKSRRVGQAVAAAGCFTLWNDAGRTIWIQITQGTRPGVFMAVVLACLLSVRHCEMIRPVTLMRSLARFQQRRVIRLLLSISLAIGAGSVTSPTWAANDSELRTMSVAELEASVSGPGPKALSFRLEGVVRAVVSKSSVVALQDSSRIALLELPGISPGVTNGQRAIIEARPGIASRTAFGIRIDNLPVIDHDGVHSATSKSGQVTLERGMNAIRLIWFNGPAESALELEYEGPGISRQKVPEGVLWASSIGVTNGNELRPGIQVRAYQKEAYKTILWQSLPDFSRLTPIATGRATNFSQNYRVTDQNCGLVFDGFINIYRAGVYTFYLASDDGSRLYVGPSSVTWKTPDFHLPAISRSEIFDRAANSAAAAQWVSMEGDVTFATEDESGLEIEMNVSGRRVSAQVIDRGELSPARLLHRSIRIEGVSKSLAAFGQAQVLVPGAAQVQVVDISADRKDDASGKLLRTAMQVQRLSPADAERHLPARIRGVVIYAGGPSVVLDDFSGGVFISSRSSQWGGVNVGLCDGHVEFTKLHNLWNYYWHALSQPKGKP